MPLIPRQRENASDSETKGMIGLFIVCSKQIKVLLKKKLGEKIRMGGGGGGGGTSQPERPSSDPCVKVMAMAESSYARLLLKIKVIRVHKYAKFPCTNTIWYFICFKKKISSFIKRYGSYMYVHFCEVTSSGNAYLCAPPYTCSCVPVFILRASISWHLFHCILLVWYLVWFGFMLFI